MPVNTKSSSRRRGNVAVLVAISIVMLMSLVALTMDGGVLQSEKRHAQATADAAALAAASVLFQQYPKYQGKDKDGTASKTAFDFAAMNGYANDGTVSVVTVNLPPKSGIYKDLDGYVEVLVTFKQQRFFSRIFGSDPIPVTARAVARGAWVVPNIGVIVLDYTGKATLSIQGNGAFTETGATVIVNSNNASALVDTGNGNLKAPEFDITGNYASSGGGQMITSPIPNNIYTGVHPTPDPLAYLPEPTMPPAGTIDRLPIGPANFLYTLTPGSFSSLPNFTQGDIVVLKQASAGNGGIFYLTNGGFNSQGATVMMDPLTSGGIMLFNAGTGTNDAINITGSPDGYVNLGPLTDGVYKGLTIFQARNATEELHIEGNGDFTIRGTIYAAGAELQVTGNGAVNNIGSQYVTKELQLAGNGNVNIVWNGVDVAPTRIITLVE